jgi:hypothetical protein
MITKRLRETNPIRHAAVSTLNRVPSRRKSVCASSASAYLKSRMRPATSHVTEATVNKIESAERASCFLPTGYLPSASRAFFSRSAAFSTSFLGTGNTFRSASSNRSNAGFPSAGATLRVYVRILTESESLGTDPP